MIGAAPPSSPVPPSASGHDRPSPPGPPDAATAARAVARPLPDDPGRCESAIALPAHVEQVDVVVQHDGSRGSYTDEALRTLWGPFAPAARVTVTVGSLTDLVIELEDA